MKKLFITTSLFLGSISGHVYAEYLPQQQPKQSVAAMSAQYSTMSIAELQKAAKAGQPAAQFYLASHYQRGTHIEKDLKQAFTWFKAAADQGIAAAQLNAGRMLAEGTGTHKNEALARQYFEKAASRGDNRASFNLAMMEEKKKNYMGAYQWYELSTRDGMLDTKVINMSESKKTALAANLTPEQIRTARERADQWIQSQ